MDTPSFVCPYCETDINLPDDVWFYTCPHCRHLLDLKAQFAYLRGLDAFSEGQEILVNISPRKRRLDEPRMQQALELFREAYSSLQVAFQSPHLSQDQRSLGVEMMASMSSEFMRLNMVSPLEMNYWKTVMVELTAQEEYDQIKEQLGLPDRGLMFLKKIRWRFRQKQLLKALAEQDKKLKIFEKQIEFIDPLRARNEYWKP